MKKVAANWSRVPEAPAARTACRKTRAQTRCALLQPERLSDASKTVSRKPGSEALRPRYGRRGARHRSGRTATSLEVVRARARLRQIAAPETRPRTEPAPPPLRGHIRSHIHFKPVRAQLSLSWGIGWIFAVALITQRRNERRYPNLTVPSVEIHATIQRFLVSF